MIVYRIVQKVERSNDLSGTGAFQNGGRWNNPKTYALYTSENSSLAYLEILANFGKFIPIELHMMCLEISDNNYSIFTLADKDYPDDWMEADSANCKILGDKFMTKKKYLAIKVRSKVNPHEYNYLLNPLFPGYHDLVKVLFIDKLNVDNRFL